MPKLPFPRYSFPVALFAFAASAGAAVEANGPAAPSKFAGATPLEWSVRMADSEIARLGNKLAWREGGTAKWDYTAGLFTLSLLKLNVQVHDPRYVQFSENAIGSFISPNGTIQGYKAEDYNLDNLNPGKTLLVLYQLTDEARYRLAADRLRLQLDRQPRTSDGGFWHKQRYPNQMWLDGLYMGSAFYAQYASIFHQPAAFDEVAKQLRLAGAHTYDPASGLFYHGWDESKQQDWANKTTGTSSNFWGRALGWYGMALVDVLEVFPSGHPARPEIITLLQKLCAGVVKHQDQASGLWYQIMDQPGRPGNYLEATASSMFVYTLAKAINRGYFSRDYASAALKAYQGLVTKLVKVDAQGQVSLTQCCSVAGLGYGRDGSYAYYVKEPVVDNDLKGVGPFILAGLELAQLLGASPEPAAEGKWERLFNGQDLAGWTAMNGAVFEATNAFIHLRQGMGWLRSEREYTNFVLEVEWRALQPNYNSGFFLRAGLTGAPFPTDVWQVNLKESALGSLMKGSKTVANSTTPKVPLNVWCKFRMELRGRKLTLDVNGERAWEFNEFDAPSGYIGLQAEGKSFDFRNLRVQPLN